MRRRMLKLVYAGCLCGLIGPVMAASSADHLTWVDAWSAAPDSAGPLLKAQTVRQMVRPSVGGSEARIRLSNLFGSASLTVGSVHVARHAKGSAIVPGSDHAVLFNGKHSVTMATGKSVLSDPVAMDINPLEELAVSIYVPVNTVDSASTIHSAGMATAYITESGDATAAVDFPSSEVSGSRFLLNDVEIAGTAKHTIVAFGDSITDGVGSTLDANQRWPDLLASRLQADPKLSAIGVANSGIGGNRILHDQFGPSALSRFDRDALEKPGVRWIVLMEGINDVGNSDSAIVANDKLSAQQIIGGMQTLIARTHARNIKIYGATLTPFGGAAWPYHTAAGETQRQAINTWIRQSGAFDGVVDFDMAIRDPSHPQQMRSAFDSGDHLHPNSAGYRAMAAAVDLNAFAGTP